MERDLQSCPSGSVQTSGMDESEGLEYKEKRRTTMMPIRPGLGGFRTDSTMKFQTRGVAVSTPHCMAPISPQTYASYGWSMPHLPATPSGCRSGGSWATAH
jgi:hypothetical protein